jgi:PadR family transcriptional regulator, regulatory protein PadR
VTLAAAPASGAYSLLSVTEVKSRCRHEQADRSRQGTLDVLILKIVALGPMHGWAIAHRIKQMSNDVLQVGQRARAIRRSTSSNSKGGSSLFGVSDNNRRAKYYSLTRAGREALTSEADRWERLSTAISVIVRTV